MESHSGISEGNQVPLGAMKSNYIVYFDAEGRENLPQVLRCVKRLFTRREDLRHCKVVIFTAIGEGPALAYNALQQWDPTIIAVTVGPDFHVVRGDKKLHPFIPPKAKSFFDGVGIPIVKSRLPFDKIEGATAYNEQVKLIADSISIFGGSFVPCVQAVLQACDHGLIEIGEKVVAVTGDSAAVVTASTTGRFLTREAGLAVNEIICKPRNLTIARGMPETAAEQARTLFDEGLPRLKAPRPKPQELLESAKGTTHAGKEDLKK